MGDDYRITDPETACVSSAKLQVLMVAGAVAEWRRTARTVMQSFQPRYSSKEAYFAEIDQFMSDRSLISYQDGEAIVIL